MSDNPNIRILLIQDYDNLFKKIFMDFLLKNNFFLNYSYF